MKIAIIGGGISGLSTAYYLKKLVPASQNLNVSIFEASSRWGGWINSKKVQIGNDTVYFEKGPRTLRLSTGEEKEINSIEFARELQLDSSIDIISNKHPASTNRYIYFNDKIQKVQPRLFSKSDLFGKPLISTIWHEFRAPQRDPKIEDESIYSFVNRRFGSTMAENIVDPVFKGICGGDVRYLSANSLIKTFFKNELEYGSVIKGIIKSPNKNKNNLTHKDLAMIQKNYAQKSVWRLKYGLEEMVEKLTQNLTNENKYNKTSNNFSLYLNESIEKLEVDSNNNKIKLKSKSFSDEFDFVISSVLAKHNLNFLSDKHANLRNLLIQIASVNIVLINFYFDQNVLPVHGFGYLVPTNQKSPILGCIFDSVFNDSSQNNTVLTVMMGGAWYDQIASLDSQSLVQLAYNELRKHLNLKIEPKYNEINILKDAIPQYKVGHENLVKNIREELKKENLSDKLYLTGNSYEGIGVNDCIYNSRKLVENILLNKLNIQ